MGLLSGVSGFILLTLLRSLIQGFVVWLLWAWFLTPIWGVVHPTIMGCAGLALLANIITWQSLPKPKSIAEWFYICFDEVILRSLAIVMLGFIFSKVV